MWDLILSFLPSLGVKWWLGGAVVLGTFVYLVSRGGDRDELDDLREEADRHDRINKADTSRGASDADNAEWLRQFGRKHRRG